MNTCVRTDGDISFPSVSNLYSFFAPRSKNITIWSIGFNCGGVEADFMESCGAKVKIFDGRPDAKEKFDAFDTSLKTHKPDAKFPWTEKLAKQWILPNLCSFSPVLPWSMTGQFTINGVEMRTEQVDLSGTPRIDIAKIHYPGLETHIIYTLLNEGYRPGLLFVNWTNHPDESVPAMLCAGHLQTTGYTLVKNIENYFLYMYTDSCYYETCSWARSDCDNPMFKEFYSSQISKGQ